MGRQVRTCPLCGTTYKRGTVWCATCHKRLPDKPPSRLQKVLQGLVVLGQAASPMRGVVEPPSPDAPLRNEPHLEQRDPPVGPVI